MERLCDTCGHKEICCAIDDYDSCMTRLANCSYDFFSVDCKHYFVAHVINNISIDKPIDYDVNALL